MAEIRLERVSKTYPSGVKAVEDISLGVRDGEFMILLGPSGCGKSTTLRMIAGLESITSGKLHIAGHLANLALHLSSDVLRLAFDLIAVHEKLHRRGRIAHLQYSSANDCHIEVPGR